MVLLVRATHNDELGHRDHVPYAQDQIAVRGCDIKAVLGDKATGK